MVTKKTVTKEKSPKAKPVKKPLRAKKAPAKKAPTAKKASVKVAIAKKPTTPAMSTEERKQRIAVAAYLRAESRGFAHGGDVSDWLLAEHEVDTSRALPAEALPA